MKLNQLQQVYCIWNLPKMTSDQIFQLLNVLQRKLKQNLQVQKLIKKDRFVKHLFVCLFICLFIHLSVYSFVCLFICLFIHLFVYSFVCLFICLFIHLFVYSFVCLFICLFIDFFCLLIFLFVYLFIFFNNLRSIAIYFFLIKITNF